MQRREFSKAVAAFAATTGLAAALTLSACGGGGDSPEVAEQQPVLSLMGQQSLASMDVKAKPISEPGSGGKGRKNTSTEPAPTEPAPTQPAPTEPAPTQPAPTDPPQSEPSVPQITLGYWPNNLLQTGRDTAAYWIEDGVWGAGSLTNGTYTGLNGSTYEQHVGRGTTMGPNGEIAFRASWKWPVGTTEVKSFPSVINGNKPGYYNTWTGPAGKPILLLNDTYSEIYPSGKTPGSIFPLQLPLASLKSSFNYAHMQAPTGRGHLSYDIWLQKTPDQTHGWNSTGEISHEIMIPLNYWGGYGAYPTRNPGWYSHDAMIDGRLWHVYYAPNFNGQWKLIVFEPPGPVAPGTLDLAAFINYVGTRKDANGVAWATGNEYAVSVELGVEPVEGTGDITVYNYRVWR